MTITDNSPNLNDRIDELSDKRKRLLAQLIGNSDDSGRVYESPKNELEKKLATIWQKTFNKALIGRHENYFALGGDSLSSIRITAQASLLGMNIKMQDLIKHPTIAQLAEYLDETGGDTQLTIASTDKESRWTYLFSDKEQSRYPLTPIQFGILYHCKMEPKSPLYISQLQCEFTGEFDTKIFHSALLCVIQRFPGVRAAFPPELVAEQSFTISGIDTLPAGVHEVDNEENSLADVAELAQLEREKGFDLENPPLMRFKILNIGSSRFSCIWTLHHLILDGWSQEIVLEELFAAYSRLSQGQDLPAKAVTYAQWNTSFHQALAPKAAAYWQAHLAGYNLQNDYALLLPKRSTGALSNIEQNDEFSLELNFTDFPILWFSEQQGITPCAVMLSALFLALFKTVQCKDSLIGTILSGRNCMDGERVDEAVGNFINCLPFRCKIEETNSLLELYLSCKEDFLNLMEYEGNSIRQIQEWSGLPGLSESLNTLFVYENFKGVHELNQVGLPISIENVQFNIMEHYPIVVTALQSTESMRVVMRVRNSLVRTEKVKQLWSNFCRVFETGLWLKHDQSMNTVLLELGN